MTVGIGRLTAGLTVALLVSVSALSVGATPVTASTRLVALSGEVPAIVRIGDVRRLGELQAHKNMVVAITLKLRNVAKLNRTLLAVSTPGSPRYGHYLTENQANKLFNPTESQQRRIVAWLTGNGLKVSQTFPNHLAVEATGSAEWVERLFHVRLARYEAPVYGVATRFYAPSAAPVIPARFSGFVQGVLGLENIPQYQPMSAGTGTRDGSAPYFPQDVADAYDVNRLWAGGYDGAGQHIGITLWTPPPSDSSLRRFAYYTKATIPTRANHRLIIHNVNGGNRSKDDSEGGMDVEYASGMAPRAIIDFWLMRSSYDPYDYNALNMAGETGPKSQGFSGRPFEAQITSSWGGCEDTVAHQRATENVLKSDSITGHNYFFSAGDSASYCSAGVGSRDDPYPQYPASSQYVTSIGGTAFVNSVGNGKTVGKWPGEVAWAYGKYEDSGTDCDQGQTHCPEGSGGGYSNDYPRPAWQTGFTSMDKRGYPDVAGLGDPNTGVFACEDLDCPDPYTSGELSGGTSLSSPIWAGVIADVNSMLSAENARPAGFIDPTLYRLSSKPQEFRELHDIVKGTNGKYKATEGWDPVSGLGSPDAYNLGRDWLGITLPFWRLTSSVIGGATVLRWESLRKVTSYNVCSGRCTGSNQVNPTPITSRTPDFRFSTPHVFTASDPPVLQPVYPPRVAHR